MKKVTKKQVQTLIKNNFGLSTTNLKLNENDFTYDIHYGKDFYISVYVQMYKASWQTFEYFYAFDTSGSQFYRDYYITVEFNLGGKLQFAYYTSDLKLINYILRDDEE